MRQLIETWRGGSASFSWLASAPYTCYKMAYTAADKHQARALLTAHFSKFQKKCRFSIELGGTPPKPGEGSVIVYNETSFIDTIAYGVCMWPHVDRGALTDLYALVPFARAALRKANVEMVPRGNRVGTDRLLKRMVSAVEAGERLAWGGEGRIHGQDGVGRFKVGSSLIAIRAQVPLVPVVFHGGHQIMPLRSIRARPGTVHVRFGEPISTVGMHEDNARDLADHLQNEASQIYANLKKLTSLPQ